MTWPEPKIWIAAGEQASPRQTAPVRWWQRMRRGVQTLKARITLAAIGSLVVGIGSISLLSLSQVERDLIAQTQQRDLNETVRIAADLSIRVVGLQQAIRSTAETIDPALEADTDALERHLQAQPALIHLFANLFVASPDGQMRLYIDGAGPRRPKISIADREYFRAVIAERRAIVSEPVPGRVSGEPVIVFGHPIVREGKVTTVLGGAIRLTSRSLAASLLDRGADADADDVLAITDGAGRVVGHPTRDLMLKSLGQDPRFAEALADWTQRGSPAEPSGLLLRQPGQIVAVAGVAGTSWNVWRALPEAVLLGPLREARLQAARNAALVIAALAVLTLALVHRLLLPLRQLEERARSLFATKEGLHEGWPVQKGEIGEVVRVLRHVAAERAQLEQFTADLVGKLASVMAAAPLGIAFTRSQRFELVSKAWCDLVQRDESELLGAPASSIFASQDDYAALGPRVGEAFSRGARYEGEWPFVRKDGTQFWGQLCGQAVDVHDAAAGTIWTLADVTALRESRETLEWSATHDPLTGLANRKAFERRLAVAAGHAPAALLAIDLDHFKPINDSHGHAAGDAMLKAVADAITGQVRSGDLAVRLGGDEFAVLLENCPDDAAQRVAHDILAAIHGIALDWQGNVLGVGASIGVAPWAAEMHTAADWTAAADEACYAAKAAGRRAVRMAVARPANPLDARRLAEPA